MKIFNYRYRWYTWLSHYKESLRICILFLPSLFLVLGWYFLYYKPMECKMSETVAHVQKSTKEQASLYELHNQVIELEKEFDGFVQEEAVGRVASLMYEKTFDSLQQAGVSVIEFQQNDTRSNSQKHISISMRLAGLPDALLKTFYILKMESIFFVVKSFEIIIPKNEINWIMNVHGELFNSD